MAVRTVAAVLRMPRQEWLVGLTCGIAVRDHAGEPLQLGVCRVTIVHVRYPRLDRRSAHGKEQENGEKAAKAHEARLWVRVGAVTRCGTPARNLLVAVAT